MRHVEARSGADTPSDLSELCSELDVSLGELQHYVAVLVGVLVQVRDHIKELYRRLGGPLDSPTLRPGGWDLAFSGELVVELDEELHFNQYRRLRSTVTVASRVVCWRLRSTAM